jgi:hypothetical protein
MGENRFPKKLPNFKPTGTRDIGRQEVDGRTNFNLLNSERPWQFPNDVKEEEEKEALIK